MQSAQGYTVSLLPCILSLLLNSNISAQGKWLIAISSSFVPAVTRIWLTKLCDRLKHQIGQ